MKKKSDIFENKELKRLTLKMPDGYYAFICIDNHGFSYPAEAPVTKLGKLEDIEQEIGFYLDWLFTAITNEDNIGVVHFKYKGKTYKIEEIKK